MYAVPESPAGDGMSIWQHTVCGDCWAEREPSRSPVRMKHPVVEVCCDCNAITESGIYMRGDVATFNCHGLGEVHQ